MRKQSSLMNSHFRTTLLKACAFWLGGVFFFSSPCFSAERNIKAEALAHYTMGLLNEWNETEDQGLEEYQKAATLDPDNYTIRLRLGIGYGKLGQLDKAVDELKKAAELNPQDFEAHYLLAIIYSSQSDDDKAEREYEFVLRRIAEQNPDSGDIPAFLGQLYFSQGKIKQAIDEFEKALLMNGPSPELYSILGSLYIELPDRDKAAAYFQKSIDLDPNNDGSLNSLGYMYAEDGINLDEAVALVQRALDIDPENGAYLDSLGWAYYKKGDYEKARLFLERALKFMQDPIIYDHLGDTYLRMNDVAAALKHWEKSLEMLPGQEDILNKIKAVEHSGKLPLLNQP